MLEDLLKKGGAEADSLRKQLIARMGDVSEFMRTLKQRFAIWFNKSHQRYGPLWSDRFKSVIVENDPIVLKTMAAYIDLNPVRAGLVEDPKAYRFCGYAEAVAGKSKMRQGFQIFFATADVEQALKDYRMVLFGKGARPKNDGSGVRMSEEHSRGVVAESGALPEHVFLLQRLKFFSEGIAIGSEQFVSGCVRKWSPGIGDKRERKPQRLPIEDLDGFTSFQNCRGFRDLKLKSASSKS